MPMIFKHISFLKLFRPLISSLGLSNLLFCALVFCSIVFSNTSVIAAAYDPNSAGYANPNASSQNNYPAPAAINPMPQNFSFPPQGVPMQAQPLQAQPVQNQQGMQAQPVQNQQGMQQPMQVQQPVQAPVMQNQQAKIASKASPASEDLNFSWGSYFQGIGLLCLLIAALLFGLWLLKRCGIGKFSKLMGRGNNLELIESLTVGPKRAVVLLRAKEQMFLVGVTENNINLISEIYSESEHKQVQNNSEAEANAKKFASLLEAKTTANADIKLGN